MTHLFTNENHNKGLDNRKRESPEPGKLKYEPNNLNESIMLLSDNGNEIPKIPSEFIEPYLAKFISVQIEGIALGLSTPKEARMNLRGVSYFVSCFCGIHAQIATNNIYDKFISMPDKDMIGVCKKTFTSVMSDQG